MIRAQRNVIAQDFSTFGFTVPVNAIPLSSVTGNISLGSLISTIVFSVPITAANSVFLGSNAAVTITSGIEIPAGIPQQYRIVNERVLIELESIQKEQATAVMCRNVISDIVPFVAWDVNQVYLIATANTAMTVGLFKEMWI
mgnify:CR=1 FL=1